MEEQPLVSIIIPTYNRAHLIGETLDSVLAQTYTHWECIIVDDGSTDDTDAVVGEYVAKDDRFKYYHRPEDRLPGGNAARNYGFEMSSGEYVNWFDSDDLMLPEFIEDRITLFNDEIKFVICSGSIVDENLLNSRPINLAINTFLFKDYVLWNLKIVTNNVLFRSDYLANQKLFNENLLRGQEAELFSRLFFKIMYNQYLILNKVLFLYRQHDETKTLKKYTPSYKSSQIDVCLFNFKKSMILNDTDLIQSCYNNLVCFFYESLVHKDILNSKYVLYQILPILKSLNKKVYFEFFILGNVFIRVGKGSYKVRKRWLKFSL
ncbi:glycosyltransferase family 2 protein [Zhouia sp. PK063]|uniref:glycosyltransferase family 2 protein n=1 Tax=Zhouia sp. PK063 TaxID=3373602 RepID=UPI0037AE0D6A